MDPVTITLFAVGMNMIGSYLKGRAEQQAAEANAQTAEWNAGIADLAGGDALARGGVMAGRVKMEGAILAGRQKAALASSGVDVQSGSAVDVQESSAGLNALDALTVQNNAAREAWGYKVQAAQFRRQAKVLRATGSARMTGAILGGAVGSAKMMLPFLRVAGQGTDFGDGSYGGGAYADEAD